jgi:uncharacterized protein
MDKKLIFNTQSKNTYLAAIDKSIFSPIPPLLLEIINKGSDIDRNNIICENSVERTDVNKEEIQYYLNKYYFMKDNGLFDAGFKNIHAQGRINSRLIKKQLANLSQLLFEVTDACNLKCKYCAYGEFYCDYDKRENSYMSFPMAKVMIDYFVEQWKSPDNLSINQTIYVSFYGGEPLLNMKLIKQIINYIESFNLTNMNFRWSMTTNGMLLDKYMDYIAEKNFSLLISLDGNEENNGYRVDHNGKNSFPKVSKNIKLLMNKHQEYFDQSVNFNSVLHNKNSVTETVNFINDMFTKTPSVAELNPTGIRPDKVPEFKLAYQNTMESLHNSTDYEKISTILGVKNPEFRGLLTFFHKYSGNVYINYSDLLHERNKQSYIPTGTCFPFGKKIFLTVNGKILPCERIGQIHQLGQVNETGIELDVEKISTKYNTYFDKLEKQCSNCYISTSCSQCIFNISTINSEVVKCEDFIGFERFRNYLSSMISQLENNPKQNTEISKVIIN